MSIVNYFLLQQIPVVVTALLFLVCACVSIANCFIMCMGTAVVVVVILLVVFVVLLIVVSRYHIVQQKRK